MEMIYDKKKKKEEEEEPLRMQYIAVKSGCPHMGVSTLDLGYRSVFIIIDLTVVKLPTYVSNK